MIRAVTYVQTGPQSWNAYCLGELIGEVTCVGRKALLYTTDGESLLFLSLQRLEEALELQGQKELRRRAMEIELREMEIALEVDVDSFIEEAAAV